MTQDDSLAISVETSQPKERFGVLSNPLFRLYWFSMFASFLGTQVQMVVQGWLVLEMTNSAFYLGLVGGAAGLPALTFSLFGGTIADRLERRKLLMFCQGTIACLKFALAALIFSGQVQVWHVMILAVALGLVLALNDPTRQAFVTELVKPEKLLSAISWTAAATNLTRIGGPMVAGALIGAIGLGLTNVLNGAVAIVAAVTLWPIPKSSLGAEARRMTVWANVKEGLSFVRGNRTVFWLLFLSGVPAMFASVSGALMPVFAKNVLDVGAAGLGQLMGASGIGALIGSVVIASRGNLRHKGIIFACSGIWYNLCMIVFAFSTWYPLSLAAMFIGGFASASWMATSVTLVQTQTREELRGRVMGLYVMALQAGPVGQFVGGALASSVGAPITVALASAIAVILNLSMLVATPVIRRLD